MNHFMYGFRQHAIVLLIALGATLSHSATFPYVSCVGKEWRRLNPEGVDNDDACVRNADVKVCRQPVRGAGTATSRVIVNQGDENVLEWLERGDPAYTSRILAFASANGELLVATLQSESQGMAMRDWNVAYIYPSGIDTPNVLHVSTAEFGTEGTLVKSTASGSGRCVLLVSEWMSRHTVDGDRLFLKGRLRYLNGAKFASPIDLPGTVRFDDRIRKLRERDDPRLPMSFFDFKSRASEQ